MFPANTMAYDSIALAAARATINKTTMQNEPTLLAILIAISMRRYDTLCIAQWRRFVAFIKVTKRHHRASTRSDKTNWTNVFYRTRDTSR
jgi:hypothetical protein